MYIYILTILSFENDYLSQINSNFLSNHYSQFFSK